MGDSPRLDSDHAEDELALVVYRGASCPLRRLRERSGGGVAGGDDCGIGLEPVCSFAASTGCVNRGVYAGLPVEVMGGMSCENVFTRRYSLARGTSATVESCASHARARVS